MKISNLRQTIKASENGLGNASADIKTLNAKTSAVNVELDKAKKDLKAARTQSSNLKASRGFGRRYANVNCLPVLC